MQANMQAGHAGQASRQAGMQAGSLAGRGRQGLEKISKLVSRVVI